jgi:hypothetical protein
MKLKRARDNAYHSLSRKWDKKQKRQGAKRQRANSKYLIREA